MIFTLPHIALHPNFWGVLLYGRILICMIFYLPLYCPTLLYIKRR